MPRATSDPRDKIAKAMQRGRKPPSELALRVAARLRSVQAELRKTDDGMAQLLSIGRSRWTNWVTAENMPEEEAMVRLCKAAQITMDWLYRGVPDQIPVAHAIRLVAREHGLNPDDATAEVLVRYAA